MKSTYRIIISFLFLLISIGLIREFYSYESLTVTVEKANFSDNSNPLLSELCSKLANPQACLFSEPDDMWEVFWDTGKGYNNDESLRFYIKSYENIIRFRLPADLVNAFRLDPGNRPQRIFINNICIENSRQKFCWQPKDISKDFAPLQHISKFSATDQGLCVLITGNDPYFGFKGHIPSILNQDTGSKLYFLYGIAIILTVGFYLLIPFIIRFFQNNPKYLEKIILSEKYEYSTQSKSRLLAVWLLLLFYFSIWAVIKPPNQSPDEIAHINKILTIPHYLWFTPQGIVKIDTRFLNPILSHPTIHFVPTHEDMKFTPNDYIAMKSVVWNNNIEQREVTTSAHSYPTLYYITVFLFSELFRNIFHLSPFDTFYIYRLVNAFLSSLLWIWVYHALKIFPNIASYRNCLFWGVVSIPMLSFICTSINPDAFIIPLTALFMIYSYPALIFGEGILRASAIFLLALFVKPSALVIFPAFTMLTCGVLIFSRQRKAVAKNFLILTIPTFIISYFAFYRWSAPVLYGTPIIIGLEGYVRQLFDKFFFYFIMYWGNLGWLDVRLDDWYYWRLRDIILLNAICFIIDWRNLKNKPWVLYLLFFALLYCCGVIAGEYHYIPKAGYTLQGRYFLPVALGLSVFLIHRFLPAKYLFIAYLWVFNIGLMNQSLYRYFNFDWGLFFTHRSIYRNLWDLTLFLPFLTK